MDGAIVVTGPKGANICSDCAENVVGKIAAMEGGTRPAFAQTYFGDAARDNNTPLALREGDGDRSEKSIDLNNLPTPRELIKLLDEHVIGQDEVKKTLAVAVYNHYSRLRDLEKAKNRRFVEEDDLKDVQIDKSNILMIGPTGCGKTLLAKTIAKILNVPFAIADATTLTEAGYVGEDVENIVRYLYNNADGDIQRTQMGIIWVDEADKIASKTQNVSLTRDVSGEGVQQALLKIIEGTTCRFPPNGGRKHPDQELVEIDTSNILFICGGAFVGLEEIVNQRVKRSTRSSAIGFSASFDAAENPSPSKHIRPEDLVAFGLIPEFVGRLPIIAEMKELTEDELVKVLTEPKNSITKQYRKLLRQNGIDLKYADEALRSLAKRAIERRTGARGLRAEMESVMREIMFTAPENSEKGRIVTITEEMVKSAA